MLCNGVSVSFQFAGKVYIGSVNMAANLEVYDVHIGQIFIHDQLVVLNPYILLVDIFDFDKVFTRVLSLNAFISWAYCTASFNVF